MAAADAQAINWEKIIDAADDLPSLPDESPESEGIEFHEWLENRFQTSSVTAWERELTWLDKDGKREHGRCDCFDGVVVYEFKTVSRLPDRPRERDVEQVEQYQKGLETELGSVVYVERGSLRVRQFLV